MKKWLASTVLCFLVFSGIFIPHTRANTNQELNDLSSNQRFYEEIYYLVNKGIITGFPDKTFRSDQAVTREQAAIMIGRALNLDGSSVQQNSRMFLLIQKRLDILHHWLKKES